jgi:hypothetical protein
LKTLQPFPRMTRRNTAQGLYQERSGRGSARPSLAELSRLYHVIDCKLRARLSGNT